jgi:hypothetical protein
MRQRLYNEVNSECVTFSRIPLYGCPRHTTDSISFRLRSLDFGYIKHWKLVE